MEKSLWNYFISMTQGARADFPVYFCKNGEASFSKRHSKKF
jgi:hypothetical protein